MGMEFLETDERLGVSARTGFVDVPRGEHLPRKRHGFNRAEGRLRTLSRERHRHPS
jgi:hypothetical protein